MTEVLAIVLGVLVVWLLLAVVAIAVLARRLGRANRVAAAERSPAPIRWQWSHSRPARLHRRLQVAVWPIDPSRAHPALASAVGTDDLRTELIAVAVDTDRQLAVVRRAPARIRRAAWREATAQVTVIEDLALRLRSASPGPRHRPVRRVPTGLEGLVERMQCLEDGRAEIAWVEAAQMGRAPAPPPPPGLGSLSSTLTPTR